MVTSRCAHIEAGWRSYASSALQPWPPADLAIPAAMSEPSDPSRPLSGLLIKSPVSAGKGWNSAPMQSNFHTLALCSARSRWEKMHLCMFYASSRRKLHPSNPSAALESVQVSALMQPLPRPSISPLYSFCSRPEGPVTRSPGFAEVFAAVWGWFRGKGPDWRQRVKEQRIVDRLADEMGDEPEIILSAEPDHSAKLPSGPTAKTNADMGQGGSPPSRSMSP